MALGLSSRRAPWLVLGVGLIATFAAAWELERAQQAREHSRFLSEADAAEDLIREHLVGVESLLYATRAMLAATPGIDRDGFLRYAESLNIPQRFPALSGLSLTKRDGEHYRLSETWPFDDKRAALVGHDFATDPLRKEAIERARDRDAPTATQPIKVLREIDPNEPGAIAFYLPIYDAPADSLAARRAHAVAFVHTGFRTDVFFRALLSRSPLDITVLANGTLLHGAHANDHPAAYSVEHDLPVAGQTWHLAFRTRPSADALSPRRQGGYVLLAGIFVSALLFWLTRDRVRAALAADLERQRFHALFMQAPVAIAIQEGPEHVYVLANRWYRQFLGNLDLVGKTRREVLPDFARLSGLLDEVYSSGKAWEGSEQVFKVNRGDGNWVEGYFNLICQPIIDANGKTGGIITFGFEVTDLVLGRKDKEALATDLEAAVRARDTFLAVASHELRTPLTTLQLQTDGVARALERKPLDLDKTVYRVEKIQMQAQRLNRLISDLLDVSRISAGRLTLEREKCDLKTLTEEVLSRGEESFTRAGCPVKFLANGPVEGSWDRLRLEQVLTNLFSNAAKYGAGKPVEISVSKEGEHARVAVRDHGIGIRHEDQARIFERFERAVSERNFGGLGLGLWISKQIISAHGGSITVESQPESGSTFTVELPMDAAK